MLRVFRAAMITALIAALPLGASSQEMQGGGMTGGMSGGAGCTQTPLQRAQDRYWNAVVDHLDFNAGRPREQIVVVTQTRRASATRIVTDK